MLTLQVRPDYSSYMLLVLTVIRLTPLVNVPAWARTLLWAPSVRKTVLRKRNIMISAMLLSSVNGSNSD